MYPHVYMWIQTIMLCQMSMCLFWSMARKECECIINCYANFGKYYADIFFCLYTVCNIDNYYIACIQSFVGTLEIVL